MAATLLSIYATPPSKLRRPTQRARPSALTCTRPRPVQAQLDTTRSALALSANRAFFGTQQKTTLTLSWNIVEQVNQIDWIGMYEIGETNPFNYIDYKSYGVCGQCRGEVQWILRKRIFLRRPRPSRQVKVCFKYYDGLTGVLRAASPTLMVFLNLDHSSESAESEPSSPDLDHMIRRPLRTEATTGLQTEPSEFIITDIQCRQLRKSRAVHSQYYSKLVYAPMSYKTKFCSNSVAPEWRDLNFVFSIDRTRELSLFIKEKTWAGSSVVGHVNVSVGYLLDQHRTVTCAHDTRQFAFVLRPVTKNVQRKSSVSGIFSGQMLLSVKFRGQAVVGEPMTVDGLLHTAPPAEARLAEATEAQLTDEEDGADDDEEAIAPLTPLADIPSDHLDGDLETAQSDPEAAEEDMACAGPSQPSASVRRTRSRRRQTSLSESNLTGSQAEPTSSGLAAMKGKNSDSGISQCSQTGDTPLKADSPIESPLKPSTRRKLSVKSPRIRRPETLSLFEGGKVTHVTNVWLCNGSDWTQQSHHSAATVLKSPYTVCTPCLSVTIAPGSSKSSECRCRRRSSAGHSIELALPSNWEARVDRHGRVFFVDHENRTTCWEKPCLDGQVTVGQKISEHAQRRQMDKRYVCLRRTIGDSQPTGSSSHQTLANDESTWPAVRFLQRPDFVSLLHDNPTAKEIYTTSSSVKHIIHRIRKDAQKFERYQHNRDLVALVNAFADQTQVLPAAWQMRQESNGKILFVDHTHRRTTFIDPRLPTVVLTTGGRTARRRRALSAPPTHGRTSSTDEYHRQVIQFLRRPTFDNLFNERLPTMAQDERLRRKLASIAKQGLSALHKLTNDVDVITVLSLFESEISGGVRDGRQENGNERDEFEVKLSNFYETLRSRGYGQGPGKIKLTLRRKHLLTDAFEQILASHKRDLQRNRICIAFDDEDGLDYGGPSREFFFLLSRDLFNPYYGLFEYSANDTYTVQMSPMSAFVDNYIEWFYFCGRVLGLALIHRYLIDTFFTRAFYKFLLKQPCSISDLESLDSQFHSSLQWLQDNPVTEDLQLTFSINEEVAGTVTEKELKAKGSELAVTEENKDDYIRRIVRWRLERGVRKQGQSLLRGFYEVVDPALVSVFDARELELVLSGTVEIDICDWRQNTEYKGGYNDIHAVICWFWQAVERFTNAQRLQLLQFVTGTSSIPYEGFVALRGSHGPKKFTIEKWGSLDSLPRAHTCFNRLDLPAYPSFHILYDKLLLAISETGCYAIE